MTNCFFITIKGRIVLKTCFKNCDHASTCSSSIILVLLAEMTMHLILI